MLNSVAIVFVLHLDNYVDLDLPDRNFFRLATSEQLKRHAARWHDAREIFDSLVRAASRRSSRDQCMNQKVSRRTRLTI